MRVPDCRSLVIVILPVLLGCGLGSDDPPVFSGRWSLVRTDGASCGTSVPFGVPVEFSQTGDLVQMTTPEVTLVGAVSGSATDLNGRIVVRDTAASRYVRYSNIHLAKTRDTIAGTATVREYTDPSASSAICEDVAYLLAVPQMRILDFNLDGATDVRLDEPLIFRCSQDVDVSSIDPDSTHVTGAVGPYFELVAVDARSFALVPNVPDFDDYSDAGLAPGTVYTIELPDALTTHCLRSTRGARLAQTYVATFTTVSSPTFVEPRRPLVHAPGPSATPPGMGDEDGCLNNPGTSLYVAPGFQTGSDATATLLCLVNDGPPHVIPELCDPPHDARDVGLGSPGPTPGTWLLPVVQIYFNEPLDPVLTAAFEESTKLPINVQLWRVGDTAANPIPLSAANQVPTNRPVLVQATDSTKVLLVTLGPVPSGTYLINVRGLTDLPGNPIVTSDRPNPATGGYAAIDATLAGVVPDGYRYYFRTP